jgi:uncharacterized pyridoxal phosphate-containing UPF0001 family protein
VDACGENKVQELVQKNAEKAYAGRPLAFHRPSAAKQGASGCGYRGYDTVPGQPASLPKRSIRRRGTGNKTKSLAEVNIGGEESKAAFRRLSFLNYFRSFPRFQASLSKG